MCGPGEQGGMRWYPVLILVWTFWVFATPLFAPNAFPYWLWPTVASFPVFLWLYFRAFYGDLRRMLGNALGIAALGYLLLPFNPGGQSYLIYACAFFPFCLAPRRAVALMLGVMAVFVVEATVLGLHWIYLLSTVLVGLVVGAMNLAFRRSADKTAELRLSHDEVRRLAALAERERIGRDLHDLLGHTLSVIALKSELAGRLFDRDRDDPEARRAAREEIREVERVARDALGQVRRAVTGIRAAGLEAELASARLALLAADVHLDYRLDTLELTPPQETALALALREAVTNVIRHARAGRVEIELRREGVDAVLQISDDGRGCAQPPGNGLNGMRERIEAIGGALRIESTPGVGTRLHLRLPLCEGDASMVATQRPARQLQERL